MFKLKPHKYYPDYMSESKKILEFKNNFIDIQQYYGSCPNLAIGLWKKDKNTLNFILTRRLFIPLSWNSFYIKFIYRHTGKCHPDLRSKFYIGKPIEKSWK